MNRIIIIVAAVIVLGGGGALFLMNEDEPAQNATTTSNDQENAKATPETVAENGNIYSLTSSGKAQQCDYSYSDPTGTGSGKMYSDGKGRGLMTMDIKTAQGNSGKSNTLVTTDKVYGWSETHGQAYGFAYDKATFTSNTSGATTSQNSTADLNQKFDLNCKNWSVDESILTVPTSVNFMTLPATQ